MVFTAELHLELIKRRLTVGENMTELKVKNQLP